MKADKLYSKGHHGHNVHFLITTYCFQGKYDKAMEAAHELLGITENPREAAAIDNWYSPHRQGWFGLMETLVHFEKWDQILDGKTLVVYDKPREHAWRHWAMGLALASKGDTRAAKAEAKAMDAALKKLKVKTNDTPNPLVVARQELDRQSAFAARTVAHAFESHQAAVRDG